jgi:hypothetical protein
MTEGSLFLLIGRINIKMAILPKSKYMFNAMPFKISISLFIEMEKSALKFLWKQKGLLIAKAIMNKKSNAGGITTMDFKLYHRDIVIKTTWY